METSMKWEGGQKFSAMSDHGMAISTDVGKRGGGNEDGYKPTELLLWGIAGCTGIDVIRILEKKRQLPESFEIFVETEQNDEYPKPFHAIHVRYVVTGDVSEKALGQAIELSESKYCVVSQTVQRETKITTSYEIR
jgi:putative redox protein